MRVFNPLSSLALAASFVANSFAAPVVTVHPGTSKDIIIDKQDTVNATAPPPPSKIGITDITPQVNSVAQLPLSFVNNFGGGAVNAYVTGADPSGLLVILQPDGTFYYPTASASISTPQPIDANIAIPLGGQGSTTNITIPNYISSARIWLAAGNLQFFTVYTAGNNGPSLVEPSAVNPSDPSADVNWGFVELTNSEEDGLFANISYVDFVGLPLGMILQALDGSIQSAKGLMANAVSTICAALTAQATTDSQPWGDLCMADSNGQPLRIISPNDYISVNPTAFENYWTGYVNEVWSYYTTNPLIIDTQGQPGNVTCQVQGTELICDGGDNRGYAQPSAADIFGCNSGPFSIQNGDSGTHAAVVPRLCAAFTRSTLLLAGGNVQPSLPDSSYYSVAPTSYYSKFVHENEMDGKGYAFSYDDVTPDTSINQSGEVTSTDPQLLTIIVGGCSGNWTSSVRKHRKHKN